MRLSRLEFHCVKKEFLIKIKFFLICPTDKVLTHPAFTKQPPKVLYIMSDCQLSYSLYCPFRSRYSNLDSQVQTKLAPLDYLQHTITNCYG